MLSNREALLYFVYSRQSDATIEVKEANGSVKQSIPKNLNQLRGIDDIASSPFYPFVRHSINTRLVKICEIVFTRNSSKQGMDNVKKMIEELKKDAFQIVTIDGSDDGPDWSEFVEKEIKTRGGANQHEVSWFFLENYVYRFLLHHLNYFDTMIDPFFEEKRDSIEEAKESFMAYVKAIDSNKQKGREEKFREFVLNALWGNKADLSLSSGVVGRNESKSTGNLLIDDVTACFDYLNLRAMRQSNEYVVIVLDNCGRELLYDLLLAFCIVTLFGFKVQLHCKKEPVFVSDATVRDVKTHINKIKAFFPPSSSAFVDALMESVEKEKKITFTDFAFYTSPSFYDDEAKNPNQAKLFDELNNAVLVIFKGDANFRRLLKDFKYSSFSIPFGDAVKGLDSVKALLSIRTMKSPIGCGIDDAVFENLCQENPNWSVDGSVGTIQFRRQEF